MAIRCQTASLHFPLRRKGKEVDSDYDGGDYDGDNLLPGVDSFEPAVYDDEEVEDDFLEYTELDSEAGGQRLDDGEGGQERRNRAGDDGREEER